MLNPSSPSPGSIVAEIDKTYYRQLGQRIAQRRKVLGITQVELAAQLGIAQQTMAHYEGGSLRVAVTLLEPLSTILGMSVEELIGINAKRTASKRGPASKLEQQLQQVSQLPRAKQKLVSEVLDSLLMQASR
jgi:transcriptional regulator with XRE-family HTH domain